jgi:hypothetical protein
LVSIGDGVFDVYSGKFLHGSLTIPDSVTTIGASAFYECSGLTGMLNIPNSVTTIGERAFAECQKLTGLTIGSAVTSIGSYAFYNCNRLTGTLTIPNGMTSIEEGAFKGCQKLTGLTIGSAVEFIEEEAFYECTGLTRTLNIPNSVITIGERAFAGCSFNDVNVSKNNDHYGLATNVGSAHILVAKADGECLKKYDSNDIIDKLAFGQLTIPDSVTTIGEGAFAGCSGLTGTLTIPTSVVSIGLNAFQECNFNEVANYSDKFVLINSAGITADKLSQTNPGFMLAASDIPEGTDTDMNIQNVVFTVGDNITIPSSISGHNVISIGDPDDPDFDGGYIAFAGSNIKTLESDSVNKIYDRSFYNCRYLTKVNFPEVKEIHESAFEEAKDLREILIPKIEVISAEAFEFADSISYVEIDASRNPEADGMDIGQIFGEYNSSTDGKLHNTSINGAYKEQWLNKLCGGDDHHG